MLQEIALIGYSEQDSCFTLMEYGKGVRYYTTAADVLNVVKKSGNRIIVKREAVWDMKALLCAVASDMHLIVNDERGEPMNEIPAITPTIRYITRKELGNILPDGWFIEHQLNRYAACHGEDMTFPHRTTIERAILDIHAFLAASAAQAASELVRSVAAQLEQQDTMFK